MRVRRTLATALAVLALAAAGASPAVAAPATADSSSPTYYVALGDSLAQGYQPGQGNTDQGYVDDVYAALKVTHPSLQLVKLGCSGETTVTMLKGGHCAYPGYAGQLAAAEDFLSKHRGRVAYVTIDIGGNDIDACATATGIDALCVPQAMQTIATNVPKIIADLKSAGGSQPVYAGTGTYDPLLAAWLTGAAGQAEARESVTLADRFNSMVGADYRSAGFLVADSEDAWQTDDFTGAVPLAGVGGLPVNVAEICTLTYMCTEQNIHPDPVGYSFIAGTFLTAFAVEGDL
jgi:lysophospholipase L1-like esterase